mmetsp:Transcript_2356/g.2685  ORF Transcript_2356/g.2685 Transcript_2356/m.2685 type:complete len:93 (-) Transcript_2356:60-338(-)
MAHCVLQTPAQGNPKLQILRKNPELQEPEPDKAQKKSFQASCPSLIQLEQETPINDPRQYFLKLYGYSNPQELIYSLTRKSTAFYLFFVYEN